MNELAKLAIDAHGDGHSAPEPLVVSIDLDQFVLS